MSEKNGRQPDGADKLVREIRRATRRHFSAEDKIRIVLAGLRGEDSIVNRRGVRTPIGIVSY
jgi:transposase